MKSMIIEHMDLKQIADSGQCFTWKQLGDRKYRIGAFGRCLEVEQDGNRFLFSCDEEEFEAVWANYFDLGTDYGALKRSVDPKDAYLREAISYGGGIRVLRQELWEVMVSFLISQNNNISRIKNSIEALKSRYGHSIPVEGGWNAFPEPDELAVATVSDLEEIGLGYRAKYLVKLAEQMKAGGLEELRGALMAADDDAARELLTSYYGIGRKVADCICLFGLHRIDMFPVDTHIRKIIDAHYGEGFPFRRYAGGLGIIQQYLFYFDLKKR